MTRHLDCPSAPLGEVEPVRLDLFLGEYVGLDLVLVDPLGLVLEDLLEEGFLGDGVSSARAELKLVSCRKSDMAASVCIHGTLRCCCIFWKTFNLFYGKGDTAATTTFSAELAFKQVIFI